MITEKELGFYSMPQMFKKSLMNVPLKFLSIKDFL